MLLNGMNYIQTTRKRVASACVTASGLNPSRGTLETPNDLMPLQLLTEGHLIQMSPFQAGKREKRAQVECLSKGPRTCVHSLYFEARISRLTS